MPATEAEQRAVQVFGALLALLGVLLLVNVTTVHALDLGGERYEYEAVPVDPGGAYLFPEGSPDHLDDIGCLYDLERDRLCAFERRALERQAGSNESAPSVSFALEAPVRSLDTPPYAFHQGDFYPYDGHWYHRTDEGTDRLGLEPVSEADVFENVARSPSELSETAARVVRQGTVTGREPLAAAGTVVDTGEGYVALESDQVAWSGGVDLLVQGGSTLVQWVLGLGLVVRGWSSARDPQIST